MGPMGPRGFRRRGRRRGLVLGAAVGATAARRSSNRAAANNEPAPADTAQTTSMSSQLTELQSLKEQGILTEAEFNAKKKQILGL